jgi:hypothetical protein
MGTNRTKGIYEDVKKVEHIRGTGVNGVEIVRERFPAIKKLSHDREKGFGQERYPRYSARRRVF